VEIPVVETERLVLREWRAADLDAYAAINADPEVRQFMHPPRPLTRAEAEAEIGAQLEQWERLGFGHQPVILKETGELIGRTGAKRHPDWPLDPQNTEVGWLFGRSAWGRGYATEAATEAARHCLETVGVPEIISIAHPDNLASHRVMEKIGLERADAFQWEERDLPVVYYRLGREEWFSAQPDG
jgi:ribosomal-protein-alanine N-acetyltransferase